MTTSYYSVGTATVDNGETEVIGVGTSWAGKVFAGDLFTDPAQGLFARVTADALSNTSLTINPWPGAAMAGDAYEVLFQSDSIRVSARTRELLEQLSVVEANGRGLFYRFSDTVMDSDPGAGYLRLNHATVASATEAYLDNLDANGASVAAELDTWDDSTSTIRGRLWLRSVADPASFASFAVTGSVVDGTGYRKLTLTYVGGSGSFGNDDELMVFFVPKGDAGDGFAYDEKVADTSELTALEGEDAGYLVFVTDLGDGVSGVVELVAGPDWQLVARYTGPEGAASTEPGPQGDPGMIWRGVYSGAAAYDPGDVVFDSGSAWVALDETTGNAPPTLPTTGNAYWELVARHGVDGAGTVASVVGGDGIDVDLTDPTAPVLSVEAFEGDSGSGGVLGGVPAPDAGDAAANKFLHADGTWSELPDLAWEKIGATILVEGGSEASIAWTDLSAFRMLRITGYLRPASDAQHFFMHVSADNGSTWITGSGQYFNQRLLSNSSTVSADAASTNSGALLTSNTVGNAGDEGLLLDGLMIVDFNAARCTKYTAQTYLLDASTVQFHGLASGRTTSTAAHDALRIVAASGNISIANLVLEGVRS